MLPVPTSDRDDDDTTAAAPGSDEPTASVSPAPVLLGTATALQLIRRSAAS